MVVSGYLKKLENVGEPGRWLRLYRSLAKDDYIDFRDSDALWFEQYDKDAATLADDPKNPLGVTVVWLKRNAQVRHATSEPAVLQGDFLNGGMANVFLMQGAAMPNWAGGPRGGYRATFAGGCGSVGCSGTSGCVLNPPTANTCSTMCTC